MSIQFELNKWWWKLQDRKALMKKYPNQYWSGKITAFLEMKVLTLATLFWHHAEPLPLCDCKGPGLPHLHCESTSGEESKPHD